MLNLPDVDYYTALGGWDREQAINLFKNQELNILVSKFREIIVNPAVIIRDDFEDFGIIYNPETDKSYSINQTGVEILKHIQSQTPIPEIADKLRENFSEVPDDISGRVDMFIKTLIDKGLLFYVL